MDAFLELRQNHVDSVELALSSCDHKRCLARLVLLVSEYFLVAPVVHGPLENGCLVELSADMEDGVAVGLHGQLWIEVFVLPEVLLHLFNLAALDFVAEVVILGQVFVIQVYGEAAWLEEVLFVILPVLINRPFIYPGILLALHFLFQNGLPLRFFQLLEAQILDRNLLAADKDILRVD